MLKLTKTIIIISMMIPAGSAFTQSVLTLGTGSTMGVFTGADLCANIVNGTGLLYGGGTICGGLVSAEEITNELPVSFDMLQNYPNPFNPVTSVKYLLPKTSYITLKLYDQTGRETAVLFSGERSAGYYQVTIDGSNLASGIYYCRFISAEFQKVIKISLIK